MNIETPAWVRDAVFYQVFPDRLARSGRVAGARRAGVVGRRAHDAWLQGRRPLRRHVATSTASQRLGITALYLNPVFASASNHRYHTDDYEHVDPLLGGNEALRELLDEAHARDMRVVLDGVFNHCGRGWWPFHHVLENGMQSPYREWFYLSDGVRAGTQELSPFPDAGAAGRDRPSTRVRRAAWDRPHARCWATRPGGTCRRCPRSTSTSRRCASYILDVAEHWIRFGIDGWRLDVAEEVGGDFWREFHARVRAADPEAYLVAEIWHHKPEWLQGDMFDAFMNYPLTLAVLGFARRSGSMPARPLPAEYEGKLDALDGAALWARIEELRDGQSIPP